MAVALETFAKKVTEMVLNNDAPWTKPWGAKCAKGLPVNALTGKPYRGCNVMFLLATPFQSRGWMTFKQVSSLGGKVLKGSKATDIFFFTTIQKEKEDLTTGETVLIDIPCLRNFKVFNLEQIELPETAKLKFNPSEEETTATNDDDDTVIFDECEKLLNLSVWFENDVEAFYIPSRDEIHLPNRRTFSSLSGFWGTAMHELSHWTGHESRLNRDMGHSFGTQKYAREELIAEISSWLLAVTLGTPHEPQNSAAYLASWVKDFKDKPREIYSAISQAQKVVDYLLETSGIKPQNTNV